ncbi:PLDc N-terminal domain-containing protein [Coprobacter tertius]|uniref:PLDc N-terminal domain-containing protein n=1 Tax=Coprobacter tertius TaxID=2944915 RepID=A0ABT1ME04_9BACT|nr:PLDc N-terminal domain-containing protein [Coprobacter tertius]MCP9610591.1 PLDc N-terminal domain-containing protein [Coprobacter tertius]
MLSFIIYIVGLICTIWCVVDVFKKNISMTCKVIVSILILLTSWIGLLVYYFIVKDNIEKWCAGK